MMGVDDRLNQWRSTEQAISAKVAEFDELYRKTGGGGGSGGGSALEGRVTKIESDLNAFRLETVKSLADIRVETAKSFSEVKGSLNTLEERTKHLPTRWETFIILVVTTGFVSTAVTLAAKLLS